jgi:DNA adenine methylase
MKGNAQPFLRWAGSKKKQLPTLSRFWNSDFTRYVEPFMGSACLFFEIQPKKAIITDLNHDLIRTFEAVRDHPQAVWNRISKIPLGKESYYNIRKKRLVDMNSVDAAASFIFLNRFCFNGLYRTNDAGIFNVPYGSTGTGVIPTAGALRAVSKALLTCTIKCTDFEKTLKLTERGDFVYLDPPYAVANRRVFRQYGPGSFGLEDLQRLADELAAMDHRGVKFLLSYALCPEAEQFFQSWPHKKIYIQRNIAGFASHRRREGELLVSNCFPSELLDE